MAKKPPGCETPERERDGHPGIDRNLQEALELGLRRRGRVARQANSRAVGLVAGPKTTCDLGAAQNRKDTCQKKIRNGVSPRFTESAVRPWHAYDLAWARAHAFQPTH